jgi:hypothetical protein
LDQINEHNENVVHDEVSQMDEKYMAARRAVNARGGPGSQKRIKVTIQQTQREARQQNKAGPDEPADRIARPVESKADIMDRGEVRVDIVAPLSRLEYANGAPPTPCTAPQFTVAPLSWLWLDTSGRMTAAFAVATLVAITTTTRAAAAAACRRARRGLGQGARVHISGVR